MQQLYLQFEKPGRREDFDYPDMAKEAVDKVLILIPLAKPGDGRLWSGLQGCRTSLCGICLWRLYLWTKVKSSSVCVHTIILICAYRALYPLGMTGIPIYNVNNNCATGSTALFLAHQLVGRWRWSKVE